MEKSYKVRSLTSKQVQCYWPIFYGWGKGDRRGIIRLLAWTPTIGPDVWTWFKTWLKNTNGNKQLLNNYLLIVNIQVSFLFLTLQGQRSRGKTSQNTAVGSDNQHVMGIFFLEIHELMPILLVSCVVCHWALPAVQGQGQTFRRAASLLLAWRRTPSLHLDSISLFRSADVFALGCVCTFSRSGGTVKKR